MAETPDPPADLLEHGRALWVDLHAKYSDFTPQEVVLLHRVCHKSDLIAALDAIVERDGLMVDLAIGNGQKTNPALVELRSQETTMARLIAALRLPDSDGLRPQHRQMRGVHAGSKRHYGTA